MTTRPTPTLSWLVDAITGRRSVPGSERDSLASALFQLYRDGTVEERTVLASSIQEWIAEVHADQRTWQVRLGTVGLSGDLVQIWTAARLLDLEQVAVWAANNLLRGRQLGWSLAIANRRSMSHDPEAALYQLLAASTTKAPNFRNLWFRVCTLAGIEWPEYYIDIGLLGLRRAKSTPDESPPWLAGLGAWLPHASSKAAFDRRWLTYRAATPRGPAQWEKWLEPIGEQLERVNCPDDRRRWLLPQRHDGLRTQAGAMRLRSPYPDDLAAVLDGLNHASAPERVHRSLEVLFNQHDSYARKTGDSYYYLRATAEAAQRLLKVETRWTAVEAVERIERGLAHEPNDEVLWNLLGRALAAAGRSSAALWALTDAVRLFPDNALHVVELARLLWAQEYLDEAENLLRDLTRRHPANGVSYVELTRLLWARNDRVEAISVLDRAPDDHSVMALRDYHTRTGSIPATPPHVSLPSDSTAEATPPLWIDSAVAEAKRADLALSGPLQARLAAAGRDRLKLILQQRGDHPAVQFYGRRHGEAASMSLEGTVSDLLERACADHAEMSALTRAAGIIGGRTGRLLSTLATGTVEIRELNSLKDQLSDARTSQSLSPMSRVTAQWASRMLLVDDLDGAISTSKTELFRSLAEVALPGSDATLVPVIDSARAA